MKKKFFSILITLVMVLSLGLVAGSAAGISGTLLSATGAIGTANEDRIVIEVPDGTTLGDIQKISWSEYLLEGYPPHVDIILDLGDSVTDALVFEYAYNTMAHYTENGGLMPYGALTGAWYQTFSDDLLGPAEVTGTSIAWLSSGSPGPPTYISGTLADWKIGGIVGGLGIDGSTPVLQLEIEVDNWVVDCEALVDGIKVVLETTGTIDLGVTILTVPDIVAISVDPTSINFGDLAPGDTSELFPITISNVGTVPVDVTTSVGGDFFIDNLYLNEMLATAYTDSIAVEGEVTANAKVIVPSVYPAGALTGTLTFEVTP